MNVAKKAVLQICFRSYEKHEPANKNIKTISYRKKFFGKVIHLDRKLKTYLLIRKIIKAIA